MPIDPKQLAAFSTADTEGTATGTGDTGTEGTEDTEGTAAPAEDQEKRLAHLVLVLSRVGEDLQGFVDEVDADLLEDLAAELPPEEAEAIEEAITSLPAQVRTAVADVGELTDADAQFVADELAGRELVDDADRFAGWLMRASQVVNGTLPHEEAEETHEEPDLDDTGTGLTPDEMSTGESW